MPGPLYPENRRVIPPNKALERTRLTELPSLAIRPRRESGSWLCQTSLQGFSSRIAMLMQVRCVKSRKT